MKRSRRGALLLTALAVTLVLGLMWLLTRRGPAAETEIYRGVTYACERLPETDESGGLFHIVRVDLSAPGIELYATPLDEQASAAGWQYRLKHTSAVVAEHALAAAVNGTQFASNSARIDWLESGPIPLYRPGDLARSSETIVSDSQVSHVPDHVYLLWFESDLTPHLERQWPPRTEALRQAKWGIGAQSILVKDGQPRRPIGGTADSRTAVGIDPDRRLIWLAAFEKASPRVAADALIRHGVRDAILVDGGSSTTLVLGDRAAGIRPGVVTGGWIPVATHFGLRAQPLQGR